MRTDSGRAEHLRVVLCWHMHQPEYRDPVDGAFMAPWVYLHALKDYTDMAAHLEAHPGACAVVDFVPVLLDQIDDYARRLDAVQRAGGTVGDPLLDALAGHRPLPDGQARRDLVAACLQVQSPMVERFPHFARLLRSAGAALASPAAAASPDGGTLADLLVWYHLAWLGESVRCDARSAALMEKGAAFDGHDRSLLCDLIREQLAALIARYRRLALHGRIELAGCPYAHPILPLLLAFDSAHQALPELPLPAAARYPGGAVRVKRQLERALDVHLACFGTRPAGCWSPEAAISGEAIDALADAGFRWTVSSQSVLRRSLATEPDSEQLHRPYRLRDGGPVVFFRDDDLSDRIGFVYKDWGAQSAVADLVERLEALAQVPAAPGRVVVLALDGENAWEHYRENGSAFLAALYDALERHPLLATTTFSRCLDDPEVPIRRLPRLIAGSWVHGELATWIGNAGRNRAWDLLAEAGDRFERADPAVQAAAERQLAVCEGSDWFWWLAEHQPDAEVTRYERMFRRHLSGLYRSLGGEPPAHLEQAFAQGSTTAVEAAVMLPHRPS